MEAGESTKPDWEAEIVVVGAGAAGLWAAAVAARLGADVVLLEKTPRTGTKVLASGGTRCNLTTTLDPERAGVLFRQAGSRFLRHAFRTLSPEALRERFDALGVPTVVAPLEKIFPASGRARDVRDALEQEARAAGVRIVLDAGATGIAREGEHWIVSVVGERSARGAKLFLCPGGKSYARTGTTGDGYAWLASLHLPVRDPSPALVPLTSPAVWVRELTGIAWQDAEARLVDATGKTLGRRRRPVLFTHTGVSGPAAMDLSVHVTRAQVGGDTRDFTLLIDLFPDVSREELRARLLEASGVKGVPFLTRILPLPRRFFAAVARVAGLADEIPRANALSKPDRHALVETLKGLPVPIDGTRGFDQAEVTAGGLDLKVVNPRTMEVNGHPGLFVFGELLDLDGPIGGLNFQAAFACAEVAALAAARVPR